jgi:hypothetical protein
MDLQDGVFHNIEFQPNSPTVYDVVVESNTLKVVDGKLVGSIFLDQRKMIKGRYVLTFDVSTALNRVEGKVTSRRESDPPKDYRAWGEVTVPEDAKNKVDPENAVYVLWIDKCVPAGKGLSLRIWMTAQNGRAVPENVTFMPGCSGLQQGDLSDLRISGHKITGTIRAVINGDGYNVKDRNQKCEYAVDAATDGKDVAGAYKGIYDKREMKKMEVAGRYYNP